MIRLLHFDELAQYQKKESINLMITTTSMCQVAGTIWCPELAPSKELFAFYKEDNGSDTFWDSFKAAFSNEMESERIQSGLAWLKVLEECDCDVNLITFNSDSSRCWRSILFDKLVELELEPFIV